MPIYEYRCKDCNHQFDIAQSFTDDALTECPSCGGTLRKVFGSVGITFKGSGFYKTDSRSAPSKADGGDKQGEKSGDSGEKVGAAKDSSSSSDSSKNGSNGKDSGSSSGDKPKAKNDSKSSGSTAGSKSSAGSGSGS